MKADKNKKERFRAFSDVFYAVKILFRYSPMMFIGGITTMTAYWFFARYVKEVLFLKELLEVITEGGTFRDFMTLLCIFCIGGVLAGLLDCLGDYLASVGGKKFYKNLNNEILRKASQADVECFENPEFYDNYKRATEILTESLFLDLNYHISATVSSVISGVFLIIYVSSVDARLLFVLLAVIAVILLQGIKNKFEYKKDKEMTPNKRMKAYVQRVVFLRDYSKDIRTSDIFDVMRKRFNEAVDSNRAIIRKFAPVIALFEVIGALAAEAFPVVATYSYAAYRFIVKKNLAVADFSVLMTAVSNIRNLIDSIGNSMGYVQRFSLYFRNLRLFLEYEPKILDGKIIAEKIETIEFRNVSFTYAGAKKPSLCNVSLKINNEETVAVVGKNGAGKSTFVKLLLRFYDPDEGEILYNGINIKEYNLDSLRSRIGTVFQDYKVFALSVKENVLCREDTGEEADEICIKALTDSGAIRKINTLHDGIDTVLTREFDDNGAGLSGGEQQKVAAARMFAHSFDMAVLDEPSSALDPIAEYKMYESLIAATQNKTVIYISHRLSSAVLSDRIFVFDGGTVAEEGTHEELMAADGGYAEMFRMQASSYNDEEQEAME